MTETLNLRICDACFLRLVGAGFDCEVWKGAQAFEAVCARCSVHFPHLFRFAVGVSP